MNRHKKSLVASVIASTLHFSISSFCHNLIMYTILSLSSILLLSNFEESLTLNNNPCQRTTVFTVG